MNITSITERTVVTNSIHLRLFETALDVSFVISFTATDNNPSSFQNTIAEVLVLANSSRGSLSAQVSSGNWVNTFKQAILSSNAVVSESVLQVTSAEILISSPSISVQTQTPTSLPTISPTAAAVSSGDGNKGGGSTGTPLIPVYATVGGVILVIAAVLIYFYIYKKYFTTPQVPSATLKGEASIDFGLGVDGLYHNQSSTYFGSLSNRPKRDKSMVLGDIYNADRNDFNQDKSWAVNSFSSPFSEKGFKLDSIYEDQNADYVPYRDKNSPSFKISPIHSRSGSPLANNSFRNVDSSKSSQDANAPLGTGTLTPTRRRSLSLNSNHSSNDLPKQKSATQGDHIMDVYGDTFRTKSKKSLQESVMRRPSLLQNTEESKSNIERQRSRSHYEYIEHYNDAFGSMIVPQKNIQENVMRRHSLIHPNVEPQKTEPVDGNEEITPASPLTIYDRFKSLFKKQNNHSAATDSKFSLIRQIVKDILKEHSSDGHNALDSTIFTLDDLKSVLIEFWAHYAPLLEGGPLNKQEREESVDALEEFVDQDASYVEQGGIPLQHFVTWLEAICDYIEDTRKISSSSSRIEADFSEDVGISFFQNDGVDSSFSLKNHSEFEESPMNSATSKPSELKSNPLKKVHSVTSPNIVRMEPKKSPRVAGLSKENFSESLGFRNPESLAPHRGSFSRQQGIFDSTNGRSRDDIVYQLSRESEGDLSIDIRRSLSFNDSNRISSSLRPRSSFSKSADKSKPEQSEEMRIDVQLDQEFEAAASESFAQKPLTSATSIRNFFSALINRDSPTQPADSPRMRDALMRISENINLPTQGIARSLDSNGSALYEGEEMLAILTEFLNSYELDDGLSLTDDEIEETIDAMMDWFEHQTEILGQELVPLDALVKWLNKVCSNIAKARKSKAARQTSRSNRRNESSELTVADESHAVSISTDEIDDQNNQLNVTEIAEDEAQI